jgi:hypothetical protein
MKTNAMRSQRHMTWTIWLYVALAVFLSLSALSGGYFLWSDPTGKAMQLSLDWLKPTPFKDYLIPGLILFSVLGVYPLFVIYGLLAQFSGRWVWLAAVLLGVATLVWLIVEVLMIGFVHPVLLTLQVAYGLLGLGLFVLPFTPGMRSKFIRQ